ncbi:MAG TPA: hypothetical protein VNS50_07130, partial [Ginsengibacter sp.]|nr:hypothetical protein [Ginsengibacter sp.]
GVITAADKKLYVHILNKPINETYIFVPGLEEKIIDAAVLDDGSKIKFKQLPEGCFIYLDGVKTSDVNTIIQLRIQ